MFSNNIHNSTLEYVSYLQSQMNGGGTSLPRPSESIRKNSLLQKFKETGWKQSVLKKRFKNLTDEMMDDPDYHDEELIQGFVQVWLHEIGFDTTIEKTLQSMGLSVSASNKAEYAISPLYNTCYTNPQLIELAIQYLLGYFNPISDIHATHYYRPEIVDTWIPFSNRHMSTQIMNVSISCSTTYQTKIKNTECNSYILKHTDD